MDTMWFSYNVHGEKVNKKSVIATSASTFFFDYYINLIQKWSDLVCFLSYLTCLVVIYPIISYDQEGVVWIMSIGFWTTFPGSPPLVSAWFAWQKCPQPRLELTSHLSHTNVVSKATRSDLEVSPWRPIGPSLWSFVVFFVHPYGSRVFTGFTPRPI